MNFIKKILKEADYTDYSDLNNADRWLANYTYEGRNKNPSKEILRELLNDYPITKSQIIYRGINFRTKEQFENFIKEFKQNDIENITIDNISSWTPDEGQAEQFAITQPSYILSAETLRLHSEAEKEGEIMTGFCGIIISCMVNPGEGINVNSSSFAKEEEVILVPGTYKIKILRILKKFKDQLADKDASIESVINKIFSLKGNQVGEMLQKFYEYIIQHHSAEIKSPEIKKKIFQIASKYTDNILDQIKVNIIEKGSFGSDDDTFKGNIDVYYNYALFYLYEKGIFNKEDLTLIKKYGLKVFEKFKEIVKKYPDYEINFQGLKLISRVCNIPEDEITSLFQKHVGTRYNRLNSKEQTNKINSIKDPIEKRKAIEKMSKDMEHILKQIK